MTTVPCNGCTACCRRERIPVLPHRGDDPGLYEVGPAQPFGSHIVRYILPREDGSPACRYLGDRGCTIHERRPYTCRIFDCRDLAAAKTKDERRALIAANPAFRRVFQAGFERMHTRADQAT